MIRECFLIGVLSGLLLGDAVAIENVSTSSYNETAPADTDIPGWSSGWAQPAGSTSTTGWNYLGSVGGNSATYLGYGWVMTAAHVGAGDFSLNNVNYPMVANSAQTIGTADLVVFRVLPSPQLPPLILATSDPVANSSKIAMLGYGHANGNRVPTWGYDTVSVVNESPLPNAPGANYSSNGLLAFALSDSKGHHQTMNDYELVLGDSGGPDFILNPATNNWELAGINNSSGTVTYTNGATQDYSGMIQIDTYAAKINQIIIPVAENDTPTLPQWGLILLAGLLFSVGGSLAQAKG